MRSLTLVFLVGLTGGCGRGPQPPGEVVFGTLSVQQGSVPSNVLTDKLSALQPTMEGCYAHTLAANPRAKGSMDMKIRGDTAAVGVEVTKNTVEDASLTQCITQAVRSVKLSDSAGSFVADWSVNFNPKG